MSSIISGGGRDRFSETLNDNLTEIKKSFQSLHKKSLNREFPDIATSPLSAKSLKRLKISLTKDLSDIEEKLTSFAKKTLQVSNSREEGLSSSGLEEKEKLIQIVENHIGEISKIFSELAQIESQVFDAEESKGLSQKTQNIQVLLNSMIDEKSGIEGIDDDENSSPQESSSKTSLKKMILSVSALAALPLQAGYSLFNRSGIDPNVSITEDEQELLLRFVRSKRSFIESLLPYNGILHINQVLNTLNMRDSARGETLIYRAILAGDEPVITALLKLGADVNLPDSNHHFPLALAIERRINESIIKTIMDKTNPDYFFSDISKESPVGVALRKQDYSLFEHMCSYPEVKEKLQNSVSGDNQLLNIAEDAQGNDSLVMLSRYIPPKIFFDYFNIPNEHGVTPLDRLMRESDLDRIQIILQANDREEVMAHPDVFISQDTIEGCMSNSEFQKIVQTPIKNIVFPLNLSQSFCDANIRMKDGSIMRLKNTNAAQVYSFLMEKKTGIENAKAHQFTIFLSPGHAFFGFENPQTQEEKKLGFYPRLAPLNPSPILAQAHEVVKSFLPESLTETLRNLAIISGQQKGYMVNENFYYAPLSNKKNHLKIKFLFDDEQMEKVKNYFNKISDACKGNDGSCRYQLWTRNCVDFAQELFEQAVGSDKGYFADFLTDDQLASPYSISSGLSELWNFKAQEYAFYQSRGIPASTMAYVKTSNQMLEDTWNKFVKILPNALENLEESRKSISQADFKDFISKIDPESLIKLGTVCIKLGVDFSKGLTELWNSCQGSVVKKKEVVKTIKNYEKTIADLENRSKKLRTHLNYLRNSYDKDKKPSKSDDFIFDYEKWKEISDAIVEIDFALIDLSEKCLSLSKQATVREYPLKLVEDKCYELKEKLKNLENQIGMGNETTE